MPEAASLLVLLILLFIGSLPIYIVSSDWGRVITNVALSYLLLAYVLNENQTTSLTSLKYVQSTTSRLMPLISTIADHRRLLIWIAIFFSLTFSYPDCCLGVGQNSNPFSFLYPIVSNSYHAITPGASWVNK